MPHYKFESKKFIAMQQIKSHDWIILPGGKNAILRFPFQGDLQQLGTPPTGKYRNATHAEVVAIASSPYPWGFMPENQNPTKLWKEKRIGYGGLMHSAWFVLEKDERIGGAPNVPEVGPSAMRHYLLTSGGIDNSHQLNDNEGYAVVWEGIPECNDLIYRSIHAHVSTHVTADRGGVVISPVLSKDKTIFVGFIGRCMTCPNPERISINALKCGCLNFDIQLHPDWKDWVL